MKMLIVLIALLGFTMTPPNIDQVRVAYLTAPLSEDKTNALYESLSDVTEDDLPIFIAYKGASTAIMAEYANGVGSKLSYFRDGRDLIELAIKKDPNKAELRYIRLSVQENIPFILGYKGDISEDKQFILDNYNNISDAVTKDCFKTFAKQSDSFSDEEKQLF